MYCGICKHQIPFGEKFTDPKNHEPNCPVRVSLEEVAAIIVEEATKEKKDAVH